MERQTKRLWAWHLIAPTGLHRHTPRSVFLLSDLISFDFICFSSVYLFWFSYSNPFEGGASYQDPEFVNVWLFLFTIFSFLSCLLSKGLCIFSKYLTWESPEVFIKIITHVKCINCVNCVKSVSTVKRKINLNCDNIVKIEADLAKSKVKNFNSHER